MTYELHSLRGRTVVVIEDDYFIMDALRRNFEARGAEIVGTVPTVKAALALLAMAPRPDVAVLDINLQGEMAFPVADMLAERGVPFVFVTGYDSAAIPGPYQNVRRFEKPMRPDDVVRALSQMLVN